MVISRGEYVFYVIVVIGHSRFSQNETIKDFMGNSIFPKKVGHIYTGISRDPFIETFYDAKDLFFFGINYFGHMPNIDSFFFTENIFFKICL